MLDFSKLEEHLATGHSGGVGVRFLDHGPDWVELILDYDAGLVADHASGVLASGPIITLMDMAGGLAVAVRNGVPAPTATLDLRIDYMRPAVPGRAVIGRAECYRITRTIAFVRGQAHDGDAADPVAHMAGTFMFLEERKP